MFQLYYYSKFLNNFLLETFQFRIQKNKIENIFDVPHFTQYLLTKELLGSNVVSDLLKGGRKLNIAEDIPLGIIYNKFDNQINMSYSNK
jgi:hypothetical protein